MDIHEKSLAECTQENTSRRPPEVPKYVEGSTKYDHGKPRMELVPLDAVQAVAEVLTFGAAKYAKDGWRHVDPDRYRGALLRHLVAIQDGEDDDPDSGLPHIAHVACNALFLTHFHMKNTKGN